MFKKNNVCGYCSIIYFRLEKCKILIENIIYILNNYDIEYLYLDFCENIYDDNIS